MRPNSTNSTNAGSAAPSPRVAAIVQARMGSSRLPGKVLAAIGARCIIDHLLARVATCQHISVVVIATSTTAADDALERALHRSHHDALTAGTLLIFRGSETDVLARFAGAAAAAEADVVVRLTGDCPLLDGAEIDRVVGLFLARRAAGEALDFLRNQRGAERRIPHGLDVEVMTNLALQRAHNTAVIAGQREHVTPWLYADDSTLRIDHTDPPGRDRSHLRLTVDTPEDLQVMRHIVAALGPDVTATAACDWLDAHPEVRALQQGLRHHGIASFAELRRTRVAGRHLLARVDAGPGIGFGHMARVEAIAAAWVATGGTASLLGWGLRGAVAERLMAIGVELIDLAAPAGLTGPGGPDDVADAPIADAQLTVAQLTVAAVKKSPTTSPKTSFNPVNPGFEPIDTEPTQSAKPTAWVLVDGYPFRAAWQQVVHKAVPLVSIDDLAEFAMIADVVVNQNVGFPPERYHYAVDYGGKLLVGAPFVLLREELRQPPPQVDVAASQRRVLVNFGGADFGGWTVPVTRALLQLLPADVCVDVLLGSGATAQATAELAELAELAEFAEIEAPPQRLRVRRNLTAMAPWIDGATLAVCAAGSTCWELLARGVVPVALPLANNQRAVADGLVRAAAGVVPGWHGDVDATAVAEAAVKLLADSATLATMAKAGAALIDGRGVWRVIDAALDAMDKRDV